MSDETIKAANAAAASDASGAQGAEEDSETEERSQEPDLGTVARERSIMGEAWEANVKRTYDVYQQISEQTIQANLAYHKSVDAVMLQILQNGALNSSRGHQIADNNMNQLATVHANLQQSQINATQNGPTVTKV